MGQARQEKLQFSIFVWHLLTSTVRHQSSWFFLSEKLQNSSLLDAGEAVMETRLRRSRQRRDLDLWTARPRRFRRPYRLLANTDCHLILMDCLLKHAKLQICTVEQNRRRIWLKKFGGRRKIISRLIVTSHNISAAVKFSAATVFRGWGFYMPYTSTVTESRELCIRCSNLCVANTTRKNHSADFDGVLGCEWFCAVSVQWSNSLCNAAQSLKSIDDVRQHIAYA